MHKIFLPAEHWRMCGSVAGLSRKLSNFNKIFPIRSTRQRSFNSLFQSNGRAVLKVFNILGQEIATLYDGVAAAGEYHQVIFDASRLASGIYFSRLEFGGKMQMKKMLLLK